MNMLKNIVVAVIAVVCVTALLVTSIVWIPVVLSELNKGKRIV